MSYEHKTAYRIYKLGPQGEKDYVRKIHFNCLPDLAGNKPQEAALYHRSCAEHVAGKLHRLCLEPHVAVVAEVAHEDDFQCCLDERKCEFLGWIDDDWPSYNHVQAQNH